MRPQRVYLDPDDLDGAILQLAATYDLDDETLDMLRRILFLLPRPIVLYVDETSSLYYSDTPLIDRFTFNMQTDELVLFSQDTMTFVDALIEMTMYMAGFTTLMGAEDYWKVEFSIGAWKPVKNSIKRQLGIPVLDEPLWVVGLPPTPEDGILEDPHPFRTLVSRLDIVSFNQMVRLAARDDVEVNFPNGADPRVIEVYIRMKTAMYQVADGLSLEDWREFNRRLLHMLQELETEYRPEALPVPDWWQPGLASSSKPGLPGSEASGAVGQNALPPRPGETRSAKPPMGTRRWDPFEAFLEELFSEEDSDYWNV